MELFVIPKNGAACHTVVLLSNDPTNRHRLLPKRVDQVMNHNEGVFVEGHDPPNGEIVGLEYFRIINWYEMGRE